jgi:hypothetical protein
MIITWTLWLGCILGSFLCIEVYALRRTKWTFSQYVVELTKRWQPTPFIGGIVAGGLAAHFWWPYCG